MTRSEEIAVQLMKGNHISSDDINFLRKYHCDIKVKMKKLSKEEIMNTPREQLSPGYKAYQTWLLQQETFR
jgi:hypothetical protein